MESKLLAWIPRWSCSLYVKFSIKTAHDEKQGKVKQEKQLLHNFTYLRLKFTREQRNILFLQGITCFYLNICKHFWKQGSSCKCRKSASTETRRNPKALHRQVCTDRRGQAQRARPRTGRRHKAATMAMNYIRINTSQEILLPNYTVL